MIISRGLTLLLLVAIAASALTFQVEPKSKDCFHKYLHAGSTSTITYFILRGGLLDIDMQVTGPIGETIRSGLVFENGNFEFPVGVSGEFKLCWNNEMARWTAKVVNFGWEDNGEKDKPAAEKHTEPLDQTTGRIESLVANVQSDQMHLRAREARHRETADSTNYRVFWMSSLLSLLLIAVSVGQKKVHVASWAGPACGL
ncbi:emp24/gp25L/p24 family protein [Planoprotostelium fungivorum]|uniref:Emp24/gp25L/p24 family protein n=1 Tax=Planoprotostelium fungivorum TaxID=1890364 RepID=A0A2P6NHW1_9EUKA|nr:emp24/gp25L/p24 family protein [Planoprotostelium fungivorum]